MKKIISLLIMTFFITILPVNIAKAEAAGGKSQKKAYAAQIKQKKEIIRQKTLEIKKIEKHLDEMGNDLASVINTLYNRETAPSEEMVNRVQDKEKEILTILVKIGKIERDIKRQRHEAKVCIDMQRYQQALEAFDKEISLLDKEIELLNEYSTSLHEFIEILKSIQLK